jgi:alkanesulfonate monooxygenase SsuD/methylene tetrahydromethanopterin reductase-like flavin-dependent oxidoreductase (luciferase family)
MTTFGVHVGPQMCTMAEMQEVWRVAEHVGFDWISVWDHFYPAPTPADGDCFEAVACHAALACRTHSVRVACLVYSAGYRHPAVLANAGVTIDHLSGGRLEMGLGAGWHQPEYDAYGIPFEAPGVRLRRMAEAIEVVRALWTQDTVDYDGEFFTLREARCNPKPVQSPPRIWVGASQPKALALAGRLGDGWNAPFLPPELWRQGYDQVRAAAPDPDGLAVSANVGLLMVDDDQVDAELAKRFGQAGPFMRPGYLVGSPAQIVDRVGEYVAAGAQRVILALRAPFDLAAVERFAAEVIPAFEAA